MFDLEANLISVMFIYLIPIQIWTANYIAAKVVNRSCLHTFQSLALEANWPTQYFDFLLCDKCGGYKSTKLPNSILFGGKIKKERRLRR